MRSERRPPSVAPNSWLDGAIRRGTTWPWWATTTGLAVLLALAWLMTYASGGTQGALPHLFYVPIVAAALLFGFRGAIPTAVLAGVVVGPLMPLDTTTGEAQQVNGWVVRAAMFLLVAATTALAIRIRARVTEQRISTEVREAVLREPVDETADADVLPEVARVLADRAFHTVYQPIYSLSDGRLVAVEALTRFDAEPARTPDVWFRAAWTIGLGADLEIAAIETAVEGTTALPMNVLLAVNVSPATLADPRLHAILTANPGRMFGLEITEHAVVDDYRLLVDAVAELRTLGVDIAVDDAGAGFASLRHIVHLAPDTIKVDLSLTQGISGSTLKRALAAALVEFAGATKAFIVAEGVESVEDLTAWAGLGATAVQGYLTGRPGSIDVPAVSPIVLAVRNGARIPSPATGEAPARAEAAGQPVRGAGTPSADASV